MGSLALPMLLRRLLSAAMLLLAVAVPVLKSIPGGCCADVLAQAAAVSSCCNRCGTQEPAPEPCPPSCSAASDEYVVSAAGADMVVPASCENPVRISFSESSAAMPRAGIPVLARGSPPPLFLANCSFRC